MSARFAQRPGETRLDALPPHADGVVFIGHIRSPWTLGDAPKNLRQARERGIAARLEIAAPFRPGLEGVSPGDGLILLYWTAAAPRDLIRQHPRHRDTPTGTFALRSPARPNPIALGVVRCLSVDVATGIVGIDATDAIDGTPLLDIKPHIPAVDTLPPAPA